MDTKFWVNTLMMLSGVCMLTGFFTIILQLLYVRKHKARIAELILTKDNPWTQTKMQVGIFEYMGLFGLAIGQALILYRWPHKNKKNLESIMPAIYTKKNYIALVEENPYWVRLYKVSLLLCVGFFIFGYLASYLKN